MPARDQPPSTATALTLHGAPASSVIHESLVNAIRQLILPGLKQLRMRTRDLEAWLDAGAYTGRAPVEFAAV